MYFWKINKLKKDLVKQPLSESESFKYLIATTISYSFGMIPYLENNILDVYSALMTGIITVFGLYYVYKCNRGSSGSNFLQKYLSIGWVMGIRWIVLVMLPIMIVYFTAVIIYPGISESTTLLDVVFFNLLYITYFLLLGKHIKSTVKKS